MSTMDRSDIWHIYPIDDTIGHQLDGDDCHCNPEVEEIEDSLLVIHNAYDDREVIEQMVSKDGEQDAKP